MSQDLFIGLDPKSMLLALREPISQIEPLLFMGNRVGAQDAEALKQSGVRSIVMIQSVEVAPFHPDKFSYHCIWVKDSPYQNIIKFLPDAIRFIHASILRQEAVFVHCDAGVSRSGSVILAYLMATRQINLLEALKIARAGRGCVFPNDGFMLQLRKLRLSELVPMLF